MPPLKDRLLEYMQKHAPAITDFLSVLPKWLRNIWVALLLFIGVTVISQWETISEFTPVASVVTWYKQKHLPASSERSFTVAVAHIEGDKNGDLHLLMIESLKSIPGLEPIRFDRKSNLFDAERPLAAEAEEKLLAREWLDESGADLILWGYVLPNKEKTVRIFMTPRSAEETLDTRIAAEQSIEFPVVSKDIFSTVIQSQVLAVLGQFDPAIGISEELRKSTERLSILIEKWPRGVTRAAMQVALGNAYRDYGAQTASAKHVTLAAEQYRDALDQYAGSDHVTERAQIRNFLGGALRILGDSDPKHLNDALTVYREALQEVDRDAMPEGWASIQSNLGIVLLKIGRSKNDLELLNAALQAHREAITAFSVESDPINWGLMQNSLGMALLTIGQKTSDAAMVSESIETLNLALTGVPKNTAPSYWAMVHNNLGAAHLALGEINQDTQQIARASDALENALEVYTRQDDPQKWAVTQFNLCGAILLQERISPAKATVHKAVKLCRMALEERTREKSPVAWAETQLGLGEALLALSRHDGDIQTLNAARAAYTSAQSVFDERAHPFYYNRAKERVDAIDGIMLKIKESAQPGATHAGEAGK